jgi:hypothetical protein
MRVEQEAQGEIGEPSQVELQPELEKGRFLVRVLMHLSFFNREETLCLTTRNSSSGDL